MDCTAPPRVQQSDDAEPGADAATGVSMPACVISALCKAQLLAPVAGSTTAVSSLCFAATGARRSSFINSAELCNAVAQKILPRGVSVGPVLIRLHNRIKEQSADSLQKLARFGRLREVWLDLNTLGEPAGDLKRAQTEFPTGVTMKTIEALAPFVTEVRRVI